MMRIWSSLRWWAMALARHLGHRGNPRLHGLELPLRLVPLEVILRQLDARCYKAKEARFMQTFLSPCAEVHELGASLAIVSYEAAGPLSEVARQVVAHNYPCAPWTLVRRAIAGEGVAEVSYEWSPERTQGGAVVSEPVLPQLRVPAESLSTPVARCRLPDSAWLLMEIEGIEWRRAPEQDSALRHFSGNIVECHDVREGGWGVPHEEVVAELAKADFNIIAHRGQVLVLRRHAS